MQYRVKTGGADTKLWDSKGRVIDQLRLGATFDGTRRGDYVYAPNGNYTKLAWLSEVAVTPPVEPPPSDDVHPVENTLTLNDGSVWHSTTWVRK